MATQLKRRLKCRTKAQYRAWLLEYEKYHPTSENLAIMHHAIKWSALVAVGEEKVDEGVALARIMREMKWEAEIIQDLEAERDALERENKRKADAVDDCTAYQEESRAA